MYHIPEGIFGTIRNVTTDLTLKKTDYLETPTCLLEMMILLLLSPRMAFQSFHFLKKAHLLSSNYTYNCVKFKIQLKLNCMKSKNDKTVWNSLALSPGPDSWVCVLSRLRIWEWTTQNWTSWRARGAGSRSPQARWSLLEWSLQVAPNHSNDVNTLLLFALSVGPPVRCFKELPGPFT